MAACHVDARSPEGKRRRPHVSLGGDTPGEAQPGGLVPLRQIATLAQEGDNCAVAARDLPRGTAYEWEGKAARLSQHCLEGHRFTLTAVPKGGELLSWGLTFGNAARDLAPGEYLINELMLRALRGRNGLDFELPGETNFLDKDSSTKGDYHLDEKTFKPGEQVPVKDDGQTWLGFGRGGGRGSGTRNAVIIVGLTVGEAAFVRAVEARVRAALDARAGGTGGCDGVCAVAHNEGGAAEGKQRNRDLLLRAVSGFVVHPNTGAALVVGGPKGAGGGVDLDELSEHMAAAPAAYPLAHVAHRFLRLTGEWEADLALASAAVLDELLPVAAACARSPQPFATLRVAQQCGGSDSFSGISGNPLTGEVSELLVRLGGLALLAETPELVGAESYILDNTKDLDTAKHFLAMNRRYKEYCERHGQDAAGNPSGGNLFRGLYNIALKSLGASRKKSPKMRLDRCVEYGERISEAEGGYMFMDSPGGDLESIAGQVACGCNVIIFITGNGAITNFPFVPTLKVVTTTGRFSKLSKDMDINAGRLVDGEKMADVAAEVFGLLRRSASGDRTRGELAGHSQVAIWRNWAVEAGRGVGDLHGMPNYLQRPLGKDPVALREDAPVASLSADLDGFVSGKAPAPQGVNLVLATSLCSGQIARLAAEHMDKAQRAAARPLRFAHLPPQTEGCGGGPYETVMPRVLVGHLRHPLVEHCYVLEHGCEKTHNDWLRAHLAQRGLSDAAAEYGWGSVQGDGGVANVIDRVSEHFAAAGGERLRPRARRGAAAPLRLGVLCADAAPPAEDVRALAALVLYVARQGGTVLLPRGSPLLGNAAFRADVMLEQDPTGVQPATLAYAEQPAQGGVHVVEQTDAQSWVETVTGLGAAGCGCILSWLGRGAGLRPGHPFVPTVHAAVRDAGANDADCDAKITPADVADPARAVRAIVAAAAAACGGEPTRSLAAGCVDYAIPRELVAVSL